MPQPDLTSILLEQSRQIRALRAELEALKRMFFEHRPPFVQAFQQHFEAVEASGILRQLDDRIARLEASVRGS